MQTTGAGVAERFIQDVKNIVAQLMKDPKAETTGVVSCDLSLKDNNLFC